MKSASLLKMENPMYSPFDTDEEGSSEHRYCCSLCGKCFYIDYKYCPKCGAKFTKIVEVN